MQKVELRNHVEFFDPINSVKGPIHIIGCGAIGSCVAELIARLGIQTIHLWDFDIVEPHNITNQMFTAKDLKKPKTEALTTILNNINPQMLVNIHPEGWKETNNLSGYVFMCVDNIETRQQIVKSCMMNPYIIAIFDFRMRLTDAQHYAANWSSKKHIDDLMGTMNFTQEEAKAATPVSACNTTLSVTPTVRTITALGIANFINFLKDPKNLKKVILLDAFSFFIDSF